MIFNIPEFPGIQQVNSKSGRTYKVPSGEKYPSVSTVLSINQGEWLQEWKDRVGEEVANKISKAATDRGSRVHEACEDFLYGRDTTWKMAENESKRMYENFLPILENVKIIRGLETQMYSDKLRVAGTCDLITEEKDGSVVMRDWKTASRPKSREDIPNYFMQMSAYSYMVFEHTGILIKKIAVHLTTPDDGLFTYEEKVSDWLPEFIKVRNRFKLERNY